MPLTRNEAQAIINVVKQDAECKRRIKSFWWSGGILSDWRGAGFSRNIWNQIKGGALIG